MSSREGSLKNSDSSQTSITEFTQTDIDNGLISYSNSGNEEGRLVLKVSDGSTVSPPAVLRIATYELNVFLMNNTGLNLVHGTSSPILRNNLSCTTNHPEQMVNVVYLITRQPVFGRIECLGNDGKWHGVRQFTESQIQNQKIRYTHLKSNEEIMDDFTFRISALGRTWPDEHVFSISFVTISVEVVRNAELIMNAIQESFISEGNLYTVTHPEPSPRSEIVYTLINTPKFGGIYLSTGDLIYQRRLSTASNFTQDDVTKGRLKYKLNYLTFSNFTDYFQFKVTCNNHETRLEEFKVRYEAPPFDGKIITQTVIVREGLEQGINASNLRVIGNGFSRMIYRVVHSPQHGVVYVLDHITRSKARQNSTYFTNREISSGLVFYRHDDSENFRDFLSFVAVTEDARPNFQIVGSLRVEIIPRNDNPPMKVSDVVFHVVRHSSRTVTPNDLTYYDADVATSPLQIKYSNIRVKSGYFSTKEDETKPIDQFSQHDINNHDIKFVHLRDSYSSASMTVTDGLLQTNETLEIVASEPYVEIVNNTGLDAVMGGRTLISNCNLSVTTNVDKWKHGVVYSITQPPTHGHLMLITGKRKEIVSIFKDRVLELDELYYQHDGTENAKDQFKFRVESQKVAAEGTMEINVSLILFVHVLMYC